MFKLETTDFKITKLNIIGEFGIKDISNFFEELNIFDNIFTPCMSGNIVIRDSVQLVNYLNLDGNEELEIEIDKATDSPTRLLFKKKFRIHKIANRTNATETAQVYVLHFVSKEYLVSERVKVQQYFLNSYTNIVQKILTDYLRVPYQVPEIMIMLPSKGVFEIIVPNLTPFDAINWISRRAIWNNNKPDYVFYQVPAGYCFTSLSYLYSLDPRFVINFQVKDVSDRKDIEFLGARDLKILTQYNVMESITSGVYGGTFIGFDTMTRRWTQNSMSFDDLYGSWGRYHADRYPNVPENTSLPEGSINSSFTSARIATYPFQIPRSRDAYIQANNPHLARYTDNTHEYYFQRRHSLGMLSQKRLQLTMPGNFDLFSGAMVELEVPKYSTAYKESGGGSDDELNGKYLITGTRHTIKYDRHETLIEVSSDSTMKRRRG